MFDPYTQRWLTTWCNNGLAVASAVCEAVGHTWLLLGRIAQENRLR